MTQPTLKLYNTMSRSVEDFQPREAGQVGLYACGFTVYDYTHLGHLRKYTMDDVLIRLLRHLGFKVTFVQNVTDVGHLSSDDDTGEDKLEKGAKKYGQSVWDIAHKFEDYFWYSMDLMGNLRPDHSTRATEHIQEQLEMVKTLEQKGFTYVIPGDGVYFDTSKFPEYGELARLDKTGLKPGARVDVEGKKNPTDFALWKFEQPGENRAMVWPSPWAERSFPGWHIECSAMAMKYLGDQFDIHTGGIDHIPVHHTNEIAQAEAATGKKPFVKYWVHHNFLRVDGEKMSKSLGNFYTIDDILQRGFVSKALRLLLLGSHYRSELNFTWESLAGAQTAWKKLAEQVVALKAEVKESVSTTLSEQAQDHQRRFWAALVDDLNTPQGMAVIWSVLRGDQLPAEKLALLTEFDQVLGLGLADLTASDLAALDSTADLDLTQLPASIQKLVAERQAARESKDWVAADRLRDQLQVQGYLVEDTAEGQQIKAKS